FPADRSRRVSPDHREWSRVGAASIASHDATPPPAVSGVSSLDYCFPWSDGNGIPTEAGGTHGTEQLLRKRAAEFGAGRSRRRWSAEMFPKELQVDPLLQLGNDVGSLLLGQSFQVGERIGNAPVVQPTLVCTFFRSAGGLWFGGHGNFPFLVAHGLLRRQGRGMTRPG